MVLYQLVIKEILGELTEALVAYQDAAAAEAAVLADIAVAVNAASDDPLTGEELDDFVKQFDEAPATSALGNAEADVAAAQGSVDTETSNLFAMRAETVANAGGSNAHATDYTALSGLEGIENGTRLTDANVTKIVNQALTEVRADPTAKAAFDDWQAAVSALNSDRVSDGSDQEVAKALYDALIAHQQAGGTFTGDGVTGALDAYTDELVKEANDQAWDSVVNAMVVGLDTVTSVDDGGTSATRSAVENTSETAKERAELLGEVGTTGSTFEGIGKGGLYLLALELQTERQAKVDDVSKAQGDLSEAQAYFAGLTALIAAHEDAVEVTEAALATLEDDFGVENLVVLEGGAEFGTANEADLYVYKAGEDNSLTNFEADDLLFIGGDFARVDLAGNVNVAATQQGDNSLLEAFFQQVGGNVVITLENEAFGGGARSGADIDVVTLAGVSLEDVSFENGYLSIA